MKIKYEKISFSTTVRPKYLLRYCSLCSFNILTHFLGDVRLISKADDSRFEISLKRLFVVIRGENLGVNCNRIITTLQ